MQIRALDKVNPRWMCDFISESISRNQEFRVSVRAPNSNVVLFETDKAIWIDVLDAMRVKSRATHHIYNWGLLDGDYVWHVSWASHGVTWSVSFKTEDACDEQWGVMKANVEADANGK